MKCKFVWLKKITADHLQTEKNLHGSCQVDKNYVKLNAVDRLRWNRGYLSQYAEF